MVRFLIMTIVLGNLSGQLAYADGFPEFEAVTIDPHAGEVVYAVTVADVNTDKKPDIVALTETQVIWYEAPTWTKHVILDNQTQPDNVCFAPHDIDGDGQIDFAVGAGWLHGKNTGTIQWITRGKNPDDKWSVHFIGEIPWTHRMRWADVLGNGQKQLVVSPLNKTEGNGVNLTAFSIPDDPKSDAWPRTVLNDSLDKMHNHWHHRTDNQTHTLTASAEGVYFIRKHEPDDGSGGLRVGKPDKIVNGFEATKIPQSRGAGEVKSVWRQHDVHRIPGRYSLVAAIEPMHGNTLAVYSLGSSKRIVLDDTLGRGHALWAADVDGDRSAEIILGHSDPATGKIKGPGIYIYDSPDQTGETWTKHVIDDGGIATEDLVAEDLNGDGKIDIVAGGRATHNVKLYLNRGTSESK